MNSLQIEGLSLQKALQISLLRRRGSKFFASLCQYVSVNMKQSSTGTSEILLDMIQ